MESEGVSQKKSPYKEMFIVLLILIIVWGAFYGIFYSLYSHFTRMTFLNRKEILLFTLVANTAFHIALILSGVMKKAFHVMKERVSTFVKDLKFGFKITMNEWWDSVKTEGIVFIIYLIVILSHFVVLVFKAKDYLIFVFERNLM